MARRKPTEGAELKLRLRESLRAAIERSARKRGRSLNQEIIENLEWSLLTKRTMTLVDADYIEAFGSEAGLEEMVARAAWGRVFLHSPGGAPNPTPAEKQMLRAQIAYCFWYLRSEANSEIKRIADVVREVDRQIDEEAEKLQVKIASERTGGKQ